MSLSLSAGLGLRTNHARAGTRPRTDENAIPAMIETVPPAQTQIRRLASGELEMVYAICQACFPGVYSWDTLLLYRARARDGILVAVDSGSVIGFVIAASPRFPALVGRAGEIVLIAVSPAFQGRGLGRELLLAAFQRLRSRGIREVRLHVAVHNERAIGLYERAGMRIEHRVSRYYRDGSDAWRMAGRL